MTTTEVANKLVSFCRAGRFLDAVDALYDVDIVSVEARDNGDIPRELKGIQAVRAKNLWWFENHEVHGVSAAGPFVSPERFAVFFTFDHTFTGTGKRSQFSEVAVYTVSSGKIVHEEFLYGAEE